MMIISIQVRSLWIRMALVISTNKRCCSFPQPCTLRGLRTEKVGCWPQRAENESEVAQSCPTLSDHMDCSPPGSSIHGILQARVLEWVAISFSRGSSQPRDRTRVSYIVGRCFTV